MPDKIQRVARALNNLLSLQGGRSPELLSDQVFGSLELLQYYGLNQLQTVTASNAAAAEGASVSVTPSARNWTVLFGAHASLSKTATMTALRASVYVNRTAGAAIVLFSGELGPFGATETGVVDVGGFLAYPLLLPPGSTVAMQPNILGTDATVNCTITVEFGLLG